MNTYNILYSQHWSVTEMGQALRMMDKPRMRKISPVLLITPSPLFSSLFHSQAPRCIFGVGSARLSITLFITLSDDVKPSVENHRLKLSAIAAIRGSGKQAPGDPVTIQSVLFTEAETYSIYIYIHTRRSSWTFLGNAPPGHRTRERRKNALLRTRILRCSLADCRPNRAVSNENNKRIFKKTSKHSLSLSAVLNLCLTITITQRNFLLKLQISGVIWQNIIKRDILVWQ